MIISKSIKGGGAFSKTLTLDLRRKFASKKHSEICECNCHLQICKGRFVRKFEWQEYCMWEMLRRGLIKDPKELVEGKKYEN